jgi:uncharacterized protein YukE
MSDETTTTLNAPRCGWQCPHGDRCTLEHGHAGGCNYRVCDCNEPSVEYLEPAQLQRYVAILRERAETVQAENGKLRELVRLMDAWEQEASARSNAIAEVWRQDASGNSRAIAELRRELRLDGEG